MGGDFRGNFCGGIWLREISLFFLTEFKLTALISSLYSVMVNKIHLPQSVECMIKYFKLSYGF